MTGGTEVPLTAPERTDLDTAALLRASEEQFRAMAENLPGICWVGDAEAAPIWGNSRWHAMYDGTAAEHGDSRGVIHADDLPRARAIWRQMRERGEGDEFRLRLLCPDGIYRPFLSKATPLRDADGAVTRWVGVQIDLSNQEALDRRQALLRSFSDQARALSHPVEILTMLARLLREHMDIDQLVYMDAPGGDAAALKVFRAVDGVMIRDLEPILPEMFGEPSGRDDVGAVLAVADREQPVWTGKPVARVLTALGMRSGVGIPIIRDAARVAGFGCLSRVARRWTPEELGLFEELAELTWASVGRARAVADLAEREERFRTLSENIPALCWLSDATGRVNWMNGASAAFFGPVDPDRQTVSMVVHPDDRPRAQAAWAKALADGEPLTMTLKLLGLNGDARPFRSATVPIHGANGAVVGWCGTMVDLSERAAHDRHQAALRHFQDATRDLTDARPILAAMGETLRLYVGASHFIYSVIGAGPAEQLDLLDPEVRDRLSGLNTATLIAATEAYRAIPDFVRPVVIPDNSQLMRAADHPHAAVAARLDTRAGVLVPIIREGELVAVVSVLDTVTRDWTSGDVALCEDLSDRFYAAVSRARAEAMLLERERAQAFLIDWTDRVRGLGDPDAIVDITVAALGQYAGVRRVTYSTADADGQVFTVCNEWRDGVPSIAGSTFALALAARDQQDAWLGGEPLRFDDVGEDPRVEQAMRKLYAGAGIRAFLTIPLIENGRACSALSLQHDDVRHWRESEVQVLREVAERVWVVLERARAEAELRARERAQAFLIDWTDRIREEPSPERIVAITLARLGEHFGVSRATFSQGDVTGTKLINAGEWRDGVGSIADHVFDMAEVGPEIAREWLAGGVIQYDDFESDPRVPAHRHAFFAASEVRSLLTIPLVEAGRVRSALSLQSKTPRRWQPGEAALLREMAERVWVTLERARAEAELKARERQQAFVIDWSDRVRAENDAAAILAATLARLGEHLGVSRVSYAEGDGETFVVADDWTDGVASIRGNRFTLTAVGAAVDREWHAGEVIRYDDTQTDPRLEGQARDRYAKNGIAAFISVPLVQGGRMQSALSVQHAHPRAWTDMDLRLVQDIAERTWVALERARAQQAMQEREREQAFLVAWNDVVRGEGSARVILARTVAMLAEHLDVVRVNYAEPDADWVNLTVLEEHTRGGVMSVRGLTYPLDTFGEQLAADQRSGQVVRVEDTHDDPRFDDENRPRFDAIGMRSALTIPLKRGDEVLAVLSAQDSRPRVWTDGEVALVSDLASRTLAVLERAQSEARLAESEALLAGYMANAPIAMYLKDARGRFLRLNEEMARVVGRPIEDALGKTSHDLMPEDVADQIVALDRMALTEGQQSAEIELPGIDGPRNLLSIRFPIALHEHGETRLGGFTLDLTARKQAEAALARSREALYQTEKLTALGSLLAGVSHELNNPLSIVVAQAVMMERQSQGTDIAERAQKIRKAADRCARIVQTFLAMARQKRPERAPVDLNAVATGAHELADYGLKNDGIATVRTFMPDLPRILADSDQLHQVIINLIVNAQQAMAEADIPNRTLTLRTGLGERPGTVVLEVSDNGPGVPVEVQRRIFEPFYTTKPQGQGTGVGLSFSQGLVEAHGGSLELVPVPTGACFRLTLPVDEDTAAAAPVDELAEPAAPARALRALVVDDERDIAEALADFLSLEGFASEIAVGGAAARERLLAGEFDLVISDVRMPDVDGPALHAFIREHRPDLIERVAFTTGDTLGQTAARFLAELDRPVLEKPFTPEAVRRLLEQMDLA